MAGRREQWSRRTDRKLDCKKIVFFYCYLMQIAFKTFVYIYLLLQYHFSLVIIVMLFVIQQSFEDAETKKEAEEVEEKPDPLNQLVLAFCRSATTEQSGGLPDDDLYMHYADIYSKVKSPFIF